jgi:hypothetical protein
MLFVPTVVVVPDGLGRCKVLHLPCRTELVPKSNNGTVDAFLCCPTCGERFHFSEERKELACYLPSPQPALLSDARESHSD